MSEYVSKQRIRYNIHFDKIKELVEAGNMWDWNDAIKVNDSDSIGTTSNNYTQRELVKT